MYQIAFDPQSNAVDWVDSWQVLGDDNQPANIYADGWTVTVRLAALPAHIRPGWGGGLASPALTATTDDGSVTVNASDALEWTFTAAQMATLCSGSYAVGCTATKAGQAIQLFLGTVPIIQGL